MTSRRRIAVERSTLLRSQNSLAKATVSVSDDIRAGNVRSLS
jgi:hypothetical protein